MPLGDWQFWIVSLAALGALWFILRPLLPKRRVGTRASLTVKGEARTPRSGC
jgi:hypothetical protein